MLTWSAIGRCGIGVGSQVVRLWTRRSSTNQRISNGFHSIAKRWLALDASNDIERVPLAPFKRGYGSDVKDVTSMVKWREGQRDAENNRIRSQYPDKSEEYLIRGGRMKFPDIVPSVFWVSGKEVTVVSMQWAQFTNDEIANYFRRWVKVNRPAEIPVPSRQGHRLISDRVNLERLAVMRLLHRYKLAELQIACPEAWKRYHTPNRRWRKDSEQAKAHFRNLLPFLPKNELPRSWPPRE